MEIQITSSDLTQSTVVLDRGDYTSCTINLYGASVTSWRIGNKEMIFVSRESHFTGLSHIRGGIQFVFPCLGHWNFGPRNGFARTLPWKLEKPPTKLENGDVVATLSLTDNLYTRSLWNHEFKLYYNITLCEKKIMFDIGVENPSTNFPVEFVIMQHSLMKVPDVTKCEIIGFKDSMYRDHLQHDRLFREDRDVVTIREETNRIYSGCPPKVLVTNTVDGGAMTIEKRRGQDINLWNPWIERSQHIENLGNDEYKYFIAVEGGVVSKYVRIEPMSCWKVHHVFEYIEPDKSKVEGKVEDFYDLFDGYC